MKKKIFTIGLSLLMGLSVFASSPVAADAKGDVSEIEYVDIDNVKAGEDDWYNNLLYLNDEKKVPDENFRKYLKTFDTDHDDVLSVKSIKSLNCSSKNISNFKGIELFTELESLDCSNNGTKGTLNLRNNKKLKKVECYSNEFSSILLPETTSLGYLYCYRNKLYTLDLSGCSNIKSVDCSYNSLTTLKLSDNAELVKLIADHNKISSVNLKDCRALKTLILDNNKLKNLDIKRNTLLEFLSFSNNQVKELDLSSNRNLKELYCTYNYLTNLDISKTKVVNFAATQAIPATLFRMAPYGIFDLSDKSDFDQGQVVSITGGTLKGKVITANDAAVKNNKIQYRYSTGRTGTLTVVITNTKDVIEGKTDAPELYKIENRPAGVKIYWTQPNNGRTYRVYKKNSSGVWTAIGDTSNLYFVDKDVESAKTYQYTVRAIIKDRDNNICYASSYDKNGISIKFYAAPKIQTLTSSKSGIKVTWNKTKGISKYRVYRKIGDDTWRQIAETTDCSYIDRNVKSGVKYAYTIVCVSSDGKKKLSGYYSSGKSITFK